MSPGYPNTLIIVRSEAIDTDTLVEGLAKLFSQELFEIDGGTI